MIKKLLCITTVLLIVILAVPVMATTWTGGVPTGSDYIRGAGRDTATAGPTTIQTGYTSTTTIQARRGLVQWNMNSAPGQACVNSTSNSVRMILNMSSGGSQSTSVTETAYAVANSWTNTTATWTNVGAPGTQYAAVAVMANGSYTWQWNGNSLGLPGTGRGVMLVDSNETTAAGAKIFDGNTGTTAQLQIDYTLPNAAGAAAATAAVNSIAWNCGDASSNETGFRLYSNAATGTAGTGIVGTGVGAGVTTQTENGLVANTAYTRYVRSYTALVAGTSTGQETAGTGLSAVTLSVAPIADSVSASTLNSTLFTWTSALAWGAGGVSSLGYVFDRNATYAFTGSEAAWTSGTLATTATAGGDWYLHVLGYNSAGVSNGSYNYMVTASVPEPGSLLALATGFIGLFGIIRRKRA